MSSRPIGIFVATVSGLAELCAEEVRDALTRCGLESELILMEGLGAEAVAPFDTLIIVSSTYGHGDIPDNGQGFAAALAAATDLKDKSFAVFALGDRTYADTFCHAGEKWDSLLAGTGATRMLPLERHDASSGTLAEDIAGDWAMGWARRLKSAA